MNVINEYNDRYGGGGTWQMPANDLPSWIESTGDLVGAEDRGSGTAPSSLRRRRRSRRRRRRGRRPGGVQVVHDDGTVNGNDAWALPGHWQPTVGNPVRRRRAPDWRVRLPRR